MKILLISHNFYPVVGGIETVSEGLAIFFHTHGYEVHVMTHTPEAGLKKFPYTIIRNPKPYQIIKELRWANIVLENNPALRLSWLNILINKPLVVGLHTWIGGPEKGFSFIPFIKKIWLKRASKVIACSRAIRNETFRKAVIIENFYDDTVFRRIAEIPKIKDFVFLGRLVVDKGAGFAIDAFKQLLNHFPDSTLTIIGEGVDRPALQKYVTAESLERVIEFKGKMQGEALVRCLNEHKFLLVPSLWKEPYGIVVLEGLACGCIPLVSDGGGLPDAAANAGLVFERGNVEDLLAKMIAIKEDSNLQHILSGAAEQHLKLHKLADVAQSYLQVMEGVL